jgi:N-acetylmuramoyl-L-alanine amidase
MNYSVKMAAQFDQKQVIIRLVAGCLLLAALCALPFGLCRAAVIVIDPGHGGNDAGAAPDSDQAEKHFTLDLAQRIAEALEPAHRVTLTRTSDIKLSPADRAGIANHLEADLMVSIHAAVPPLCNPKHIAIYVHNDDRLFFPKGTAIQKNPLDEGSWEAWEWLQVRHRHQSKRIAAAIKQTLEHSPPFESVWVADAPLVVLMGADMPALLMELGCIHPAASPAAQIREQRLADYANAIAEAIDGAMNEVER